MNRKRRFVHVLRCLPTHNLQFTIQTKRKRAHLIRERIGRLVGRFLRFAGFVSNRIGQMSFAIRTWNQKRYELVNIKNSFILNLLRAT